MKDLISEIVSIDNKTTDKLNELNDELDALRMIYDLEVEEMCNTIKTEAEAQVEKYKQDLDTEAKQQKALIDKETQEQVTQLENKYADVKDKLVEELFATFVVEKGTQSS